MSAATVVARGKLGQYRDVNYLLLDSFEILPPRPAGNAKPKDQPPGKGPAVTSPAAARDTGASAGEAKPRP